MGKAATPETAPKQLELFGEDRLRSYVSYLRPDGTRKLVGGLLFAAAEDPSRVSAIDDDGEIVLKISYPDVAKHAGCSQRSLQRYRTRCTHTCCYCRIVVDFPRDLHGKEVEPRKCSACKADWRPLIRQDDTVNTAAEWLFNLSHLLPADVFPNCVDWYEGLIASADPHHQGNSVTPVCRPDSRPAVAPTNGATGRSPLLRVHEHENTTRAHGFWKDRIWKKHSRRSLTSDDVRHIVREQLLEAFLHLDDEGIRAFHWPASEAARFARATLWHHCATHPDVDEPIAVLVQKLKDQDFDLLTQPSEEWARKFLQLKPVEESAATEFVPSFQAAAPDPQQDARRQSIDELAETFAELDWSGMCAALERLPEDHFARVMAERDPKWNRKRLHCQAVATAIVDQIASEVSQ